MHLRIPIPFLRRSQASLLAAPMPPHPVPRIRRSWIVLYVWATLTAAGAAAFILGRSSENYIAGVYENHWSALTTRPAAEASAWESQRRAQGALIAQVAQVARDSHPVSMVLRAMVGENGCEGAWLITPAGEIRAGTGASGATPLGVIASHRGAWTREVMSDSASVRTIAAPHVTYLDVVAPVGRAPGDASPLVVLLRFDLATANLPPLMPPDSAAPTPTLAKLRHTLLLARDGDSVRVLRVAGGAPLSLVGHTFRFATLPSDVRAALDGQWAFGRGPGVLDPDVMFAVRAVPGLHWAVLREASYKAVVDAASGGSIGFNRIIGAVIVIALSGMLALAFVAIRLRSAQAFSRLRTNFIAGISHEVRTPLAQVRMFAELLHTRRITSPEDVERSLRIIETEAQRLSVLLDDILDFSAREHVRRASSGASGATTRVHAVVRETLEAFAPLAAERDVEIMDTIEGEMTAAINATALRHVLTNLLANAVKYGPVGGAVIIGASEANGIITILVDDEGAGVPHDERERIWLPFERGRRMSTHAGGYGIGLAVARELVTRSGGTTRVEDAPSGGARFVVTLPVASASEVTATDPLVGAA